MLFVLITSLRNGPSAKKKPSSERFCELGQMPKKSFWRFTFARNPPHIGRNGEERNGADEDPNYGDFQRKVTAAFQAVAFGNRSNKGGYSFSIMRLLYGETFTVRSPALWIPIVFRKSASADWKMEICRACGNLRNFPNAFELRSAAERLYRRTLDRLDFSIWPIYHFSIPIGSS